MNTYNHNDQTAVVTGGAQGFGFEVAKRLLRGGAKVALWDQSEAALQSAKAQLEAFGTVRTYQVDVSKTDQVDAAIAATESDLGGVSILVHSAGIAGIDSALATYPGAEWERVIQVNLNGSFYVNQAIVRGMITRNYGRIVNIASVAGKEGNPNASAYSASKAGLIAMTKSLGKETAKQNIAVNCITPAAANTKLLEQVSPKQVEYMLAKIPRGRFLEIDELASMVAWLTTAENSFTTASVFDLSGGRATY